MTELSRVLSGPLQRARGRTASILLAGSLSVVSGVGGQPVIAATAPTNASAAARSGPAGTPVIPNDANRGDGLSPKSVSWDKHFDPRRSVFLPDRSDARYAVYRNRDGTETVRLSIDDRLIPDGRGGWKPVDLGLTIDGDGRLRPRAAIDAITFAPVSQRSLARLTVAAGSLDLSLPSAVNGVVGNRQPGASGETIRYEGALPGRSTVELTALSRGYQSAAVAITPISAGLLTQELQPAACRPKTFSIAPSPQWDISAKPPTR